MRKLFVLFLLVALVPFTVGCNGLWDFDDDSDPVATTGIKLSRTFPAGSFTTKGATVPYVEDLTYVIDGITMVYSSHTFDDNGNLVVVFKATITTAAYNALQAKATAGTPVAAKVMLGSNTLATETAATLPTTIATSTTSDTTVVATAVAITVPVVVDATTISDIVTAFKVSAVTYGGNPVSTDSNAPTNVIQTPTFKVTFDAAPVDATTATFEVKVTNLTTKNSFTLTSLTQGGLTVDTVPNENNAVTIAIVTNTIGKTLVNGSKYSIALIKTNLKNAAGTPLTLPGAYYVKGSF